ncbi:MAG: GMC family oxidoreductase N-terminal domain-containing protein, partial [Chloroflexi bacterium]|nr:GMC family oxidoreductase N-terminal domain-containing protein [Chloroflexota bacterium]
RADVLAHRLLFEGNRAVGVEAESGGEVFQVFGDEVILSGGAINSPQLLMLSGIGPRQHLEQIGIPVLKDAPGVGENLRDHPACFLLFETNLEEPPKGAPAIQVGMRYTTPGSPHENDMQMSPILMTSEHRPTTVEIPEGETYTGFSVALQKARTAGRIKLVSSDPRQHPDLDYRYLTDPWDRERMRGAIRLCLQLTEGPELSEVLTERVSPTDADLESDDALDAWMLANVGTQHHSSGTCKMGPESDPMAVVDQYLRVHGIERLRVIDASVMPDVVRANTNATTIMIAEKAAEWLSEGTS